MEGALTRLAKTIASGRLKDRYKMERRLGRIQARHPQVNDLYEVALRETKEGVRLTWEVKKDRHDWREQREGAYMLRTNIETEKAEDLWSKYMQLTEAEASLALKSELAIRPLFHQLENRVKAHVMVAFLGLCVVDDVEALDVRLPSSAQPDRRLRPPLHSHAGTCAAVYTTKRRHRFAYYRRSRNPSPTHHRANSRTAATAGPAGNHLAASLSIQSKMQCRLSHSLDSF
jgi:hypothetical protein